MSTAAKPAGTSGSTIVFIILGLVLVPVILIGGCCVGCVGCAAIFGESSSSHPLVLQSKEMVKADPQVKETFGEVTELDFRFVRNTGGFGDDREYTYEIKTAMAEGEVTVMGSRDGPGSMWTVEDVTVDVDGGDTIFIEIDGSGDGEMPADDGTEPADDGPAPEGDAAAPVDDAAAADAAATDAVAADDGEETP